MTYDKAHDTHAGSDGRPISAFSDLSTEWFWETDAELRYVWFSDNVERLIGVAREWHYGRRRQDLLALSSSPEELQQHLDTLARREPFDDFIFCRRGPNGDCWIKSSGRPRFDADGAFLGYRGSGSDVTQLQRSRADARSADDRLNEAVRSVLEACALYTSDGRLLSFNQRYVDFHDPHQHLIVAGVRYDALLTELTGRGFVPEAVGRERAWSAQRLREFRAGGCQRDVRRNGRWLHLQERRLADGCLLQIGLDISERKKIEQALQRSEERFRRLIEGSLQGILVHRDGELLFANQAFEQMFGFDDAGTSPAGKSLFDMIAPHDVERARGYAARRLSGNEPNRDDAAPSRYEIDALRQDGTPIRLENMARVVDWEGGKAIQCTMVDVTARHRAETALSYQATHDSLTRLINRAEFERLLSGAVRHAQNTGGSAVLCYLDLDQFKLVNDTAGHAAGDQLLVQVTNLITSKVRRNDLLGRLGGDEFGLLLPDCGLDEARRVAESLISELQAFRFIWRGNSFEIGVSIGVVRITGAASGAGDLLSQADIACYAAKDRGRNRAHVYQMEDEELRQRREEMQVAANLRDALDQGRFRLAAQPIRPLSISSDRQKNRVRRYEILLRLHDADGQEVMPGAFIPAAERYGLMHDIDRWVIEEVLDQFDSLFIDPGRVCVSINLSGMSLTDEHLLEFVQDRLARSSVRPQQLCFEITETAAIRHFGAALHFVTEMKKLGCRFALDDFGSGLSSFGYLKQFPVDYLKIDGVFIRNIIDNTVDRIMVDSITRIARAMQIETISESVESGEALEVLRALGVDYAQGYAVGRPLPLAPIGRLASASDDDCATVRIQSVA